MRPDKDTIKQLASELLPYITGVRRHIHRFPELSFEEFETAAYIKSLLHERGIPFTDGWVKTGIVATVAGSQPGPHAVSGQNWMPCPSKKTIISLINRRSRVKCMPAATMSTLPRCWVLVS